MYIIKHTDLIDANEPQLGSITENELMADEGDARELLIEFLSENQEVEETFYAIDDYTDEDIELLVADYLDDKEIDLLKAAFIVSSDWTEEQLHFLLEMR